MSFSDLQNNVFKCCQRDHSVSENGQICFKLLCRGFTLGVEYLPIDSSCNLHLRDSVFFFFFFVYSSILSLKNIKFFVAFFQIRILEILTSGDSDIVPKAMPCGFYLDPQFFIFC